MATPPPPRRWDGGRRGWTGSGAGGTESCLSGRRRGRRRGHDEWTHPGVGGKDAELADADGRGRDERGQPAEEGHRSRTSVSLPSGDALHPVGEPPPNSTT